MRKHIFDAHVHVGRWLSKDFLGRTTDLAETIGVLSASEITHALLMPTDEGDNHGLLSAMLEHKGSPYLLFCAWVDPQRKGMQEFLETHTKHICALKIHPSFLRKPVTDQDFLPFLEFASKHALPVIVHCGKWKEVAGFEHVLEVATRYPDVTFILSHMGGDYPPLVLRTADAIRDRGISNCLLGTESIREYWLIRLVVDLVGHNSLIFGSDFNLNHPKAFIANLKAVCLTQEEEEAIFYGNAMKIWGHHVTTDPPTDRG